MKKTLFKTALIASLGLFTSQSFANVEEIPDVEVKKGKGFHGMIGLAAISAPEYVGGSETETSGIPLINVDYNDTVYFKFNRAGWWLWKPSKSNFRLGLELGMRRGWERDDLKSSLDMMDLSGPQYKEVEGATLFGINAAYNSGRFNAEISFLGSSADENFYGVEPGSEVVIRTSYTFLAKKNFSLTASAKIEALSEDTVDYFYGVNGYKGDASTNVTAAVIGTYKLSKKWTMLGGVGVNSLGDEIADSPIVADDSQSIALLGAAYTF